MHVHKLDAGDMLKAVKEEINTAVVCGSTLTARTPVSVFVWKLAAMLQNPYLTDARTLRKRVRRHIDDGAATVPHSAYRDTVLQLLNDSLATEIVCVLRYQRYQFLADGIHSNGIAEEFVAHASEEQGHADQIAERIVQLGGEPDFSMDGLISHGHPECVEGKSILDLVKHDMISECLAMDGYRDFLRYLGDYDLATRQMIEEILAAEKQHGTEMADLLEGPTDK